MDTSIFTKKEAIPTTADLTGALGETFDVWQSLVDYVHQLYPNSVDEWNCTHYGWSFRMKDKKRVLIYLLPRDKFFKAAFVFGQKATDIILQSPVAEAIKKELGSARVYAEGRGIRIDIQDNSILNDIKKLIEIKLAN
jgi:hypothetical protein